MVEMKLPQIKCLIVNNLLYIKIVKAWSEVSRFVTWHKGLGWHDGIYDVLTSLINDDVKWNLDQTSSNISNHETISSRIYLLLQKIRWPIHLPFLRLPAISAKSACLQEFIILSLQALKFSRMGLNHQKRHPHPFLSCLPKARMSQEAVWLHWWLA